MSHPKGMGLLEIRAKKFRLIPIKFTQIRPFLYGDLSLSDVPGRRLCECRCVSRFVDGRRCVGVDIGVCRCMFVCKYV